jgi:hypothetical protein
MQSTERPLSCHEREGAVTDRHQAHEAAVDRERCHHGEQFHGLLLNSVPGRTTPGEAG